MPLCFNINYSKLYSCQVLTDFFDKLADDYTVQLTCYSTKHLMDKIFAFSQFLYRAANLVTSHKAARDKEVFDATANVFCDYIHKVI